MRIAGPSLPPSPLEPQPWTTLTPVAAAWIREEQSSAMMASAVLLGSSHDSPGTREPAMEAVWTSSPTWGIRFMCLLSSHCFVSPTKSVARPSGSLRCATHVHGKQVVVDTSAGRVTELGSSLAHPEIHLTKSRDGTHQYDHRPHCYLYYGFPLLRAFHRSSLSDGYASAANTDYLGSLRCRCSCRRGLFSSHLPMNPSAISALGFIHF